MTSQAKAEAETWKGVLVAFGLVALFTALLTWIGTAGDELKFHREQVEKIQERCRYVALFSGMNIKDNPDFISTCVGRSLLKDTGLGNKWEIGDGQ